MRNVKIKIEYDGTNYSGWQIQGKGKKGTPTKKTLQQEIESALSSILQEDIKITGSGRTDAGVHASCQIANFKTSSKMPVSTIQRALNGILPDDIVILNAKQVRPDFHSRFSAVSKTYSYRILNRRYSSAFGRLYHYHIPYKLDSRLMARAAKALIGKKDFKSFQAKDKKECNSIREIKRISVRRSGSFIIINIQASGFLYNMARNIVGTLIEIGRGKMPPESIKAILSAKDRTKAGPTAPARGLCLVRVGYARVLGLGGRG